MVNDLLLKDLSRDDLHTIFTCQVGKKIQLMGKHLLNFSICFHRPQTTTSPCPSPPLSSSTCNVSGHTKEREGGSFAKFFNIFSRNLWEGGKRVVPWDRIGDSMRAIRGAERGGGDYTLRNSTEFEHGFGYTMG